ncbi:unknown [Prevotella sp. CAG:891]|nr:unknown [Prevotella sp. CAG:891]
MVDEHGHVGHLVCRNNQRAVVGKVARHHFAKQAFRRNVQSVRRFVHQQQAAICGQRKTHECLFLLSHRQCTEVQILRKFKVSEALVQNFVAELRIKRCVQVDVAFQRNVWQIEFLGHEERFAQHFRSSFARLERQVSVFGGKLHMSLLRTEQSRHQVEQRAFARTVFAQQSIDASGFDG